ncbi:hypothetical protein [uncultured Streptococcus sp.]|jgi:hypothetical protein|uniref:hypothetical protein n=1 Tax=uncultured Streptococcus sp. TaxID=83427 RepID=UPI0028D041F7|nr:hypothetical protein [uncultured Streptococcus sp.]
MTRVSRYLIISEKNKSNKILHAEPEELISSINKSTELDCESEFISAESKKFKYNLKSIKFENQTRDKRFFILVFHLDDESNIEQFEFLDSEIRNFIESYSDLEIFILEDAISQYYSKEAYELIHIIENKTRALISEVMFLKSETQAWEHPLTKNLSIRDTGKSNNKKYKPLDGKYFSDLTTMLFTIFDDKKDDRKDNFNSNLKYFDNLMQEEFSESSTTKIEELRIAFEEIKKTAPRSIWDRYIASSLKDSEKLFNSLNTVLKQLEAPRNDIAHNTVFRKESYTSLRQDVEKVVLQIDKAIEEFENRSISKYSKEEEKEVLDILDNSSIEETVVEETTDDDLTIIVPAQEDGFQQVFLKDNEWYDIRIGKRRTKIRYIAGYEVKPRSGIQYIAKVKDIIPSENYFGYWKVIFDGKAQPYDHLIPLGNTYPPQNIRYTTKRELDEVAEKNETLEKIFNNPY